MTSNFWPSLQATLAAHLPGILGALLILIVGWLLAVLARAAIRRGLAALRVNRRISDATEQPAHEPLDVESGIATAVFWIIILITLIGVFSSLNLDRASQPFDALLVQVFSYLPRVGAAILLLILAWVIASAVRALVTRALAATSWDERLSQEAGMQSMSVSVGNVLFWLVILLFIPAIVGTLDLGGLLSPVSGMVDETLGMLPNIFAALVIGVLGWLVAKLLSALVTRLLGAWGVDRLAPSAGVDPSVRLSKLAGTIVFILVFVPALIAALDALQIEAISRPATDMLHIILAAVPNIIAAALILIITYFVARFGATLVESLLRGVGFDALPAHLGLTYFREGLSPSRLVGRLVLLAAMLFATVEAANRLGFTQVRDVVTVFIVFAGDVLLGTVILLVGFWLANFVYEQIRRAGGEKANLAARIARWAILGLVIAMGLRAMGIADDIVNLAFGLTLGAVAVAIALSFGLGGREAAGRQMEYWLAKLRKDGDRPGASGENSPLELPPR
jgi:hypothetical protein